MKCTFFPNKKKKYCTSLVVLYWAWESEVKLCNPALILRIERHFDCGGESQTAQVSQLLIANTVALSTLTCYCPLQNSNDHVTIMAHTRGCS